MRTLMNLGVWPAVCVVAVLGSGPSALAAQPPPPPPTVVASEWSAPAAVATVTCPAGTQLIGGGFDSRLVANLANQVMDAVEANAPDPELANTWKAQAHRGPARAFAMCSPDAPTPVVVASEWSPRGAVARATCPAGTQLVGGGQDARMVTNLANVVVDGVELNAPDPGTANTWQVQLHIGQARAFAMCTAQAPTPTVVASDWSAPGAVAYVTCPTGTQLVGGGVDSRLVANLANQLMDDVEANAPDPELANTWKTRRTGARLARSPCAPRRPRSRSSSPPTGVRGARWPGPPAPPGPSSPAAARTPGW